MPVILRKIADEGTSTSFVARITLGVLELRDHALNFGNMPGDRERTRLDLDAELEPLVASLSAVRAAARGISDTVSAHAAKVQSGEIASLQRNAISVSESIDAELTDAIGKIYERGYSAKERLQAVTRRLGLEIGFLFQKDTQFETGCAVLRSRGGDDLANYLATVRSTWSEAFFGARAAFTHKGQRSLECRYAVAQDRSVQVVLPEIEELPVDQYARVTANRLIRMTEDLVACAVGSQLDQPVILAEIAREQRDPSFARRFAVGMGAVGNQSWVIAYEEEDDLA